MAEGLVERLSSGGAEGPVGGVSMKEIFDDRRVPNSCNSGVSTEEQSFLSYVLQGGRTLDPRKRVLCLARLLQQEFTRMEAGEKQHLVKEMECYISDIFEEGQKIVEAETSPHGDKEKACENIIPIPLLREEQQEGEEEEHKDSVEDDDLEDGEDEEIVDEDEQQNNKNNKKMTKRNYYGHREPLYWNGGSRANNKKKHTTSSSIAAVPNEQRLDDPSDGVEKEEELSEEQSVNSSPSSSTIDPRMERIFVELQSHYDAVKTLMEQPEDVLLEQLKAMKSTTDEISTNTNEVADLAGLAKEFELPNDTLVSLATAVRHGTTYKRIGVQLRALISVQLAQLQQTMSGRRWTPFRDRFCQLLGLQQRSIYKYAAVGRMLSASLALFCATLHSTALSFNDLNLLQSYLQKEAELPTAFLNLSDRTVSSHLVLKLLQYWITPSPSSVTAEEDEEEDEQTQRNAKRPRPRTQPPRCAKRRP